MPSLTAESVADFESPYAVRISPDGKQVVYELRAASRKKKDAVTSLWAAEVGKQLSARQITAGTYYDTTPRFSPDGQFISFISDRSAPGKSSAIYLLPTTRAGDAIALTPAENEKSIESYEWSPDGQYIAYASSDEKTKERREKDEKGDDAKVYGEHREYARLRIVNVKTKEMRSLVTEDAHVANLTWSPDGQSIAYALCQTPEIDQIRTSADLHVISVKNMSSHKICHLNVGINDLVWCGDELYWISHYDGQSVWTSNALWAVKVDPDSKPSRIAYGQSDCCQAVRRCGDEPTVLVQRGLSDHLELARSLRSIFTAKRDISAGWDVWRKGEENVVVFVKGSLTGGQIVSHCHSETVELSQHEKFPDSAFLHQTDCIEFPADDGTPIDGVLCHPASHEPRNEPPAAVVLVHGGPYHRSAIGMDPAWHWTPWFLSRGYAVLHPNYRGGSGHGAQYAETVRGNVAASYQDVIALVKKCIADGKIDPHRTSIAGWSQGGYLTYLAVTRDESFHFAAAIAGAGVSCWDTMSMTSDVPILESGLAGKAPWVTNSNDTLARDSSPIWHMQKKIATPLLILHGEEDVRVPVGQAKSFHNGMLAWKRPCEMVIYPREGHGTHPKAFERAHVIHMLETIEGFLGKHLCSTTEKRE